MKRTLIALLFMISSTSISRAESKSFWCAASTQYAGGKVYHSAVFVADEHDKETNKLEAGFAAYLRRAYRLDPHFQFNAVGCRGFDRGGEARTDHDESHSKYGYEFIDTGWTY